MSGSLPLRFRRAVVEEQAGSLWQAPTCPFCGQVMAKHRALLPVAGPPSYACEQHGNADMVFAYEADPKPAAGASGVPFNVVVAFPVHHYEGGTAVVHAW